jgi:parallel beta-helix repeat protein
VLYSDNNEILENTANNNEKGIYLGLASYNLISKNTVISNDYGIELEMLCNNNTINENIVIFNGLTGITIDMSNWNKIFLNCIANNSLNARDDGSENQWDNGKKGNYWGQTLNYNPVDANGDGISDIPYNITGSAGSQDRFPLIKCPLPLKGAGFPIELIIIISVIAGGAVIGVATLLLLKRRKNRIE